MTVPAFLAVACLRLDAMYAMTDVFNIVLAHAQRLASLAVLMFAVVPVEAGVLMDVAICVMKHVKM